MHPCHIPNCTNPDIKFCASLPESYSEKVEKNYSDYNKFQRNPFFKGITFFSCQEHKQSLQSKFGNHFKSLST